MKWRHTDRQTDRQTIKGEWKQYCTSLVNKCRRRGNKTGKPKGDKSKGVKPPQRQGRASRSSHHFHFHRKFAYSSIYYLLRSGALRAPSQQQKTPFSLSVHFFVIQKCSESKAKKFPGDAKKFLVIEKKFPVIEKCSVRFCSQLLVKLFLAHTQSVTLSK